MSLTVTAPVGLDEIAQFLYREARLLDEHDYDAWEALWTDDALYWVPGETSELDPATQMSVIYDNRSRISTRLKQLKTGRRYSQSPPSELSRMVGNIEITGIDGHDISVAAKLLLVEGREEGNEVWAARTAYRLRTVDDSLRLAYKKVTLVNRFGALPTLAFLI
jgi:benzoate/toluate 1,2-dioxygenase beta subunit